MDRMAISYVGIWFSNSTNLLSELLKDLRMLALTFKSPLGHNWRLSNVWRYVYSFVFCIVVKYFVDLNMYFAGAILQSIWMYV